jgi:lipid-binding SYLF domain-containing protein
VKGYWGNCCAGTVSSIQFLTRIIIVFIQEDALQKFRESKGWEAGVDGSVTLVNVGAAGSIDTTNIKDQIVGFVFGNKGLIRPF